MPSQATPTASSARARRTTSRCGSRHGRKVPQPGKDRAITLLQERDSRRRRVQRQTGDRSAGLPLRVRTSRPPAARYNVQPKHRLVAVVAVGASWVRDAFDPTLAERLLGEPFFNFGVSGGRPYESQRFLESALAFHQPEHVILNLNSFEDQPDAFRTKFNFTIRPDAVPTRQPAQNNG